MSKFIRTLIIINGILIPIPLIIMSALLFKELLRNYSGQYTPDAVNTENVITKHGDTLIAQGIRYDSPENIYNSTNYMIRVMPKTFDNPQKLNSSLNFEGGTMSRMDMSGSENYLNILFLNSEYKVIGKLLDKKASINSVVIPTGESGEKDDTTVKNIAYLIAFNDSNHDKKINWEDNFDLYISNLDGKELTQVTKGIDVVDFKFINRHNEIFISYTDRGDIKDEYKIKRFASYNIRTRKYSQMTDIDSALKGIQRILY
jgi:hypothetical protein